MYLGVEGKGGTVPCPMDVQVLSCLYIACVTCRVIRILINECLNFEVSG